MNATLTQVSEVGPFLDLSNTSKKSVDLAPVVLWSGTKPVQMLRYEIATNRVARHVSERFEPMDGHRHGPFPITASGTLSPWARSEDELDLYDTDHVIGADLDGNGVEELVLFRQSDAIEAFKASQVLFKSRGSGFGVPRPMAVTRVRLPGREVLLVLYRRSPTAAEQAKGSGDRYALLRVDARGAAPIALVNGAFQPKEILAVGALNRPGSAELDEILVLSRLGEGPDVHLSRHAPDGKLLGALRRLYAGPPPSDSCAFEVLPQSARAVAFDSSEQRAYFFAPEKPVNWLRSVDLAGLSEARHPSLLGVVDPAHPKVAVRGSNNVYLLDEEGTAYGWSGGTPVPKASREPFYRNVLPTPKHRLVGIYSSRATDAFLVVHARPDGVRELTEAELLAAAERFLPAKEVAEQRRALEPNLETPDDRLRDSLMREERAEKHITVPVRTIEEWKRLLPASYAKVVDYNRIDFKVWLKMRLLEDPDKQRSSYRDYDGHRDWLGSQRVASETVFTLVRRGERAQFWVPGTPPNRRPTADVKLPDVDFRADQRGVTAVLALERETEPGEKTSGFFMVQASGVP